MNLINKRNRPQILWVQKNSGTKEDSFSHLQISYFSYSQALDQVIQQKPEGYFIDMDEPEAESFLLALDEVDPASPRVLVFNELSEEKIVKGLNTWRAFDFLIKKNMSQELELLFKDLKAQGIAVSLSRDLRKELSQQKKKLEKLNESLEKIVNERTEHIERSRQEESAKLQRERNLIRLIKDLSFQNHEEEFLQIFRRELRKFQKLGDPFLIELDTLTIFHLSNGHGHEIKFEDGIDLPKEIEFDNISHSQFLANIMGRPFVKTIAIPFPQVRSLLVVEHHLAEMEKALFHDVLRDWWPILNMALQRQQSEKNLSLFSYRWEKTFDGIKDPIAIINSNFQIIRSNKQFSEPSKEPCYKIFAQRQEPCENCPLPQTLRLGASQKANIQVQSLHFQVSSFPLLSSNSEAATAVVHQYQDVTHSRQLYLRLVQSEKMGALGALAGHLAHELNNPLTGILSLSQVILSDPQMSADLKKDLGEIEKATLRSQKIIKNLIEFVQEEKGTWEEVCLDEVIEKTMPMLKTILRGHNFQMDLQTGSSLVFAEPQLLQQVVFNLLNNAAQAMPQSGRITLTTQKVNKDLLEMVVSDEGAGIPPEIQSRIFEPFFTTKQEGFGTGLGLSLTKSIVEKFNGKIFFKSEQNKGTQFFVQLPLRKKKK